MKNEKIKISEIYNYNEEINSIISNIFNKQKDLIEDVVQDIYVEIFSNFDDNKTFSLTELKDFCKKFAFKKYHLETKNPFENSSIIITKSGEQFNFLENIGETNDIIEIDKDNIQNLSKKYNKQTYKGNWLDFETARDFARSLNFSTHKEWSEYCKTQDKPENIPAQPFGCIAYKDKWIGWDDWLGVKKLSFEEARNIVISTLVPKGIDTITKWRKLTKLPPGVPKTPYTVYKEFISWQHWFGKDVADYKIDKTFLNYKEAKKYVQENLVPLGIDTITKYRKYKKIPNFLPKVPYDTYKNKGWIDSSDFFGTNKQKFFIKKSFWNYSQATEWVRLNLRPLGINKRKIFYQWLFGKLDQIIYPQRPLEMPSDPDTHYKSTKEWISWGHFLGTLAIYKKSEVFWPYETARQWMIKNFGHIEMTFDRWEKYKRGELPIYDLPESLHYKVPKCPDQVYYNNGWVSWEHWFGKEKWNGAVVLKQIKLRKKIKKKQIKLQMKQNENLKKKGIIKNDKLIILATSRALTGKQLIKLLKKKKNA